MYFRHTMRLRSIVATLFLGGVAVVSSAQGFPRTVAEQYLFGSVNAERAAAGLQPLKWDDALESAADFHARQMRSLGILSHQLNGEPDLTERAAKAGARFSRVSENVAVGPSILRMHDALMRSPHHRENILDPNVDTVAISVLSYRGQLWAVEDFTHTVVDIDFAQQEVQVVNTLETRGVTAEPTEDARATCLQDSGYVGQRPGFIMRYTTADLTRVPDQLLTRLQTGRYQRAAVGACSPGPGGFSSYSIAVMLYR